MRSYAIIMVAVPHQTGKDLLLVLPQPVSLALSASAPCPSAGARSEVCQTNAGASCAECVANSRRLRTSSARLDLCACVAIFAFIPQTQLESTCLRWPAMTLKKIVERVCVCYVADLRGDQWQFRCVLSPWQQRAPKGSASGSGVLCLYELDDLKLCELSVVAGCQPAPCSAGIVALASQRVPVTPPTACGSEAAGHLPKNAADAHQHR